MRRILRTEAVCLRNRPYRESSSTVTLFTRDHGLVSGIARGARRTRSKFGAALDLLSRSRVIYHFRDNRGLYNISDAELIRSGAALTSDPSRFVAAEQFAELCLRVLHPGDPHQNLYDLLVTYLAALETAPVNSAAAPGEGCRSPIPLLVCSYLLKAASFLGFKPELRRCVTCDRPVEGDAFFDTGRGGTVCATCGRDATGLARLVADARATLLRLLLTPAAELCAAPVQDAAPLPLVLGFVEHHFDPLVLNSFRRYAGLD